MNKLTYQFSKSSGRKRKLTGLNPIQQEKGVVAIIVALSMVVLIGFVGLALDLGKLFVAKTELQNSADSCALAAARELTGANANQLALAEAAGIAAGIQNDVLFQHEPVNFNTDDSVTFSEQLNGSYVTKGAVADPLKIKFVRCTVERTGIVNWFMQVLGIGDQDVRASAVGSMLPSLTSCALPIAVCESNLSGKSKGEWLESLLKDNELTGDFLWVRYGNQGGKALKDILTGAGQCNLSAYNTDSGNNTIESEPGDVAGAFDAWNTRFGVYKGAYNASNAKPDFTGFAYTAKSWDTCKDAYALDYSSQEGSANRVGKNDPIQDPSLDATGLKVVPPATSSSLTTHAAGENRRLAIVPVVDCEGLTGGSHTTTIKSWACVLMLHPLDQNAESSAYAGCSSTGENSMFLEYLGDASESSTPCGSAGALGGEGSVGPLVPALVQ